MGLYLMQPSRQMCWNPYFKYNSYRERLQPDFWAFLSHPVFLMSLTCLSLLPRLTLIVVLVLMQCY